jgi:hypothetical protein
MTTMDLHISNPDEAVKRWIKDTDHVHLAATISRPNAMTCALARQFAGKRGLTVSTTAFHSTAHALTISGAVKKVITGFLGDTFPSPRPNLLYQEVANDIPFEVEAWSLLTYTQRLMAAALNQPFATTSSNILGSDLSASKTSNIFPVELPDGSTIALMKPLRPDWALYHGVVADRSGNVVIGTPGGESLWAAFAAKKGVIASVEKVVDSIENISGYEVIPQNLIKEICIAERGAHPQSLRSNGVADVCGYDDDYGFLNQIVEACQTPQGAEAWYEQWVGGIKSHQEYLARLDADNHNADGCIVHLQMQKGLAPSKPSKIEQLIILAARTIVNRIETGNYDTILAGVGISHMAAWLAATRLKKNGIYVQIVSELGFIGVEPSVGDTYLFSQKHRVTAYSTAGIAEVLGGLVAANPRCLGVLSAAEISPTGVINTSLSASGKWITGSGGANDIASTSDCVVVAPASTRRYVKEVAHRTSPGDHVTDVVSQFGRFTKDKESGTFHLASWIQPPDCLPMTPELAIQTLTQWESLWEESIDETPILEEELSTIRELDPEGYYR